ncbi:MAG: WYL domain-containing transcriptional regulator [Bacillota bacterium]|nr:WYL domain-containing transcriptional regulator [Bacillota bacterium]
MRQNNMQRLRLLRIMQILQEESDEQHTITLNEMSVRLKPSGISFDRKSLYYDIQALREIGMDIILTKGNRFGYFWANRSFEIAEIKLLIDAIQSSIFLTAKKSKQLIDKLCRLVSKHDAKILRRYVFIDGRHKAQNECIYYAIDRLHESIANNRMVSFKYFEYTLTKSMRHRRNGQIYTVSPYALHWDGNKYYLIADYPKHGISHFRVDKITDIVISDESFASSKRNIDLVSYIHQTFSMYGGDIERVTIVFDNSLIGSVIDRFGTDIQINKEPDQHFSIQADVKVSPSFLSWIFQFSGNAVITEPESVVLQMKRMLEQQYRHYLLADDS